MKKKINNANFNQNIMEIFIKNKVNLRTNILFKNQNGHFITRKGPIHWDLIILNIYVPNNKVSIIQL